MRNWDKLSSAQKTKILANLAKGRQIRANKLAKKRGSAANARAAKKCKGSKSKGTTNFQWKKMLNDGVAALKKVDYSKVGQSVGNFINKYK